MREEYERTVQEIEADTYLPLTNQVIHWPRRNTLCLPVFQDQNKKVDTLGQCGDGDKGDGSMSSSASRPCESPNILNWEPSGSETEIQTAMTSIEVGETRIGATKLASTSDLQPESLQPGSPPFLERMSLSTLPEVQETCRPLHNTEPQASTLPFPATHSSAREQPENLPLSPCAKLSASVIDQPQWRSGIPLFETAVGSWLELPEPTLSDLPQDRESLTKLKAQLAMELLWIKQAIASRQNVNISVQQATATICCILVSHPPPTCFFGTRFAGHYCIFYQSHALYASMLLIYMLICYPAYWKTARRCLPP